MISWMCNKTSLIFIILYFFHSRADNHVAPMVDVCDPCLSPFHFDVIGNMETFKDDLAYIMTLFNVTFKDDVNLSRETKLDAIYDSIQGNIAINIFTPPRYCSFSCETICKIGV